MTYATDTSSAPSRPPTRSLLDVAGLTVRYGSPEASPVLRDLSLSLASGEMLAIVGESGSGKSTLIRTILGLLPAGAQVADGRIEICGQSFLGATERARRAVLGPVIGFVPQDPANSLDPLRTVGEQIEDLFVLHTAMGRRERREKSLHLLERVGLSEPERRQHSYPHELSGGMQQRVLIAAAIALKPAILIADEATSALDVSVQKQVMDLLDRLKREDGIGILFVTHDLMLASERAERLAVLEHGRIVDTGDTARVLSNPVSPYTSRLLRDAPSFRAPETPRPEIVGAAAVAVAVEGVWYSYRGRHKAATLRDMSFSVLRGTTHAIVGESGAGKSTLLKCLMGRLVPDRGSITIEGAEVGTLRMAQRRAFSRTVQIVYQHPGSSFNPRQDVEAILEEPLKNYERLVPAARRQRVLEALAQVRLPEALLARRPKELSGGQLQRLALARALMCKPNLLIMDEIVSALDVTVQASILKLIEELQQEFGLTCIFVSHDLAVIRQIADTVTIMAEGRAVQSGPVEEVFEERPSPYTAQLISAQPRGFK